MKLQDRAADAACAISGSFNAFLIALSVVIVWSLLGPHYDYSDTWQLVINTGTTIVTFLLGFLIQLGTQRASKKQDRVLHLLDKHQKETHAAIERMEKAHRRMLQHLGVNDGH